MAKALVLLSGGLDSSVALYDTRQKHEIIGTLSFDYGSKHNASELPMAAELAQKLGIKHEVIRLDFMNKLFKSDLLQNGGEIPEGHYEADNMKATVVPFRNGIMLAIAGGLAESIEADLLVIAAHSGDHAIYPDCREAFMTPMGQALEAGTYNGVKLFRPFIAMSKAEIVQRGTELGVDFSRTWSCYKGGATHCGRCGTCVERREAFIDAGITDPTVYLCTESLPKKPEV